MAFRAVKNIISAATKAAITGYCMLIIASAGFHAVSSFQQKDGVISSGPNGPVVETYVNAVSDLVDETDFKDRESVDDTADSIKNLSEGLAESEDLIFQKVSLTRVVDGDTIVVDIYGDNCGEKDHQYTVRLIGVNTPESVASQEYLDYKGTINSDEGREASEFVKGLLKDTEYVYLQKDTSETDRYDRLLRYVWLDIPENEYDLFEVQTEMLNGILVTNGYAEAVCYKPDVMYADYFDELEGEYESSLEY